MNDNDFLLDIFQERQEHDDNNSNDSFLALPVDEVGETVSLSSPVSASTTVDQVFYLERQKLKVHLD